MNRTATLGVIAVALTLSGCAGLSSDQNFAVGGLAGGAAGLALADATKADGTGKALGTLAGAAIGSSLAATYAPR
jgi:hypothetical protein